MGLLNRLRSWRIGAVTGVNATENNVKMSGALLLPFIVMWFIVKLFLPDAMYDLAVSVSMGIWVVWIVMLVAYAKIDANNYIVFPQSKWRFPDGTCRTFDLKIPPDSWENIITFDDGSIGYKVYFSEKYLYQHPDLPYPYIFDCAYWVLPKLWDTAFQRRAIGEFFHKGVFVTKPDCEDISVYVLDFEERDGVMFPTCIINDCTDTYEKTMENHRLTLVSGGNPMGLLYSAERRRNLKLSQHSAYLEDGLDVAGKDASKSFKDSADKRLKNVRRRHGSIMDTGESWTTKYLNLKTLALVALAIVGIWFVGNLIGVW